MAINTQIFILIVHISSCLWLRAKKNVFIVLYLTHDNVCVLVETIKQDAYEMRQCLQRIDL